MAGVVALAQTTTPNVEDVEEVRVHVGGAGEYKTLFELPGLTDEQRKAAQEKLDARNASLQAFNESEQGKRLIALRTELAAARRDKETDKVGSLREQIQPLADAYLELRNKGRIEILSVLTPDQLARYGSRPRVGRTDPEQSDKVAAICLEAAHKHFQGSTLADDPFFHKTEALVPGVRKRVVEEVFTDAQREQLKRPASAPVGAE